jgi:ABC-type nitrate/sulfonate/bicarbonate transport system substrate-binding protein
MASIRVGGVPEHFNYPWHLGKEKGYFANHGVDLHWSTIKNGTGAMITALQNNEVDVIAALTEGLVSDIVNGSDIRLFATYVESPLRWCVITGKDAPYNSVEDLKGHTFAISRFTSGSHLMAGVLASDKGWEQNDIQYKVVGSLAHLKASVGSGETAAFMWEYFTTKPYVDSGEVKFIGELTTPWSCFMLAAKKGFLEDNQDLVKNMLEGLNEAVTEFHSSPDMDSKIASEYGLQPEDAKAWYSAVKISGSTGISETSLTRAVQALQETKVITSKEVDVSSLVDGVIGTIKSV